MWKSPLSLVLLAIILSCVIGFSGCAVIDKAFTAPGKPVTQTVTNASGDIFLASYTPLRLRPDLLPGLDAGQTAVGFLPTPAREIGGTVLAAVGALATLYVRGRNKSRRAQAVLASVIRTVEQADIPTLKQAVRVNAEKDGTETDLHKAVKKVTVAAVRQQTTNKTA